MLEVDFNVDSSTVPSKFGVVSLTPGSPHARGSEDGVDHRIDRGDPGDKRLEKVDRLKRQPQVGSAAQDVTLSTSSASCISKPVPQRL